MPRAVYAEPSTAGGPGDQPRRPHRPGRRHENLLKLWDLLVMEPHTVDLHHRQVKTAAFSPDGRSARRGGQGRHVRMWDGRAGKSALRLAGAHEGTSRRRLQPRRPAPPRRATTRRSGCGTPTGDPGRTSRATRRGQQRRLQPGRQAARLGERRQDGQAVGRGHGREVRTFEVVASDDPVLAVALNLMEPRRPSPGGRRAGQAVGRFQRPGTCGP